MSFGKGSFVAAVRQLAADSPDFVYEPPEDRRGCRYVFGGVPSCLIGQALVGVGVPIEQVADLDDYSTGDQPDTAVATVVPRLLAGLGVEMDSEWAEIIGWANYVQVRQDRRDKWGRAVAKADFVYPLPKRFL